MLSVFEKKSRRVSDKIVLSPVFGESIALEKVNDPAFASGCLGPGIAVIPSKGKLYSPVSGEILVAYSTGHAIGIKGDNGIELLLHVGIDTVRMNGKGFDLLVEKHQHVKRGDVLLNFDINEIRRAGYDPTVMIIITNAQNYSKISTSKSGRVKAKDMIFRFE